MPIPQVHVLDSNVARTVEYDAQVREMVIDFAKPNTVTQLFPPKRYRYFEVPAHHFANILEERRKKDAGDPEASEGAYILKHIVGPRKGPAPYRFEKLVFEKTAEEVAA